MFVQQLLDAGQRLAGDPVGRLDVRAQRGRQRDLNLIGVGLREELDARGRNGEHRQNREERAEHAVEQAGAVVREDQVATTPAVQQRTQQTDDDDEQRQGEQFDDRGERHLPRAQVHEPGDNEYHGPEDQSAAHRRPAAQKERLERVQDDSDQAHYRQDGAGDRQHHAGRAAAQQRRKAAAQHQQHHAQREASQRERVAQQRVLHRIVPLQHPAQERPVAPDQARQTVVDEPVADRAENVAVEQVNHRNGDGQHHQRFPVGQPQHQAQHQDHGGRQYAHPSGWTRRLFAFYPHEVTGKHRIDHQRHEQRRGERDDERQWQKAHELADCAGPEEHGHERRHRRGRRGYHGSAHFGRGQSGRLEATVALLPEAIDVLDNDDGIVDEHAQRDDQREENHEVERVAERLEDQERGEHRQRNGNAHERGRAHAQEEQQHRHHEDQSADDVVFQVADERTHVLALVARDDHFGAGREGEAVEHLTDGLGRLQNVGA